ncbi:helix-turn-helix domain-containing protein [Faecalimonas umbilicata]|nr:helix-turn-helix domain-containing protein [Faecalimonas umbilicata]
MADSVGRRKVFGVLALRHMLKNSGKYHREGGIALGSRVVSQWLMETGKRIRKRRQELHWSQEYFAEKAGISVNTVIRIEGGQSATSIEVFEKIAEALKTDVNTLLGKTAAVPPEEKQLYHMACRIRRLDKNRQEIVMRTMDVLIDEIRKCGKF